MIDKKEEERLGGNETSVNAIEVYSCILLYQLLWSVSKVMKAAFTKQFCNANVAV